jgi:hypothetical protein
MKEYHVTKQYVDADEDQGFHVVKIKSPENKDITSKIDRETLFDDDDDLVDYLAEVFDQDPDDIEVIEDELTVEYSGNEEKLDPDGAGMIKG